MAVAFFLKKKPQLDLGPSKDRKKQIENIGSE
jgi:hypothetical protein